MVWPWCFITVLEVLRQLVSGMESREAPSVQATAVRFCANAAPCTREASVSASHSGQRVVGSVHSSVRGPGSLLCKKLFLKSFLFPFKANLWSHCGGNEVHYKTGKKSQLPKTHYPEISRLLVEDFFTHYFCCCSGFLNIL